MATSTDKRSSIEPRRVDQHFRVVLPKAVVAAMDLQRGSHIHFLLTADGRVEVRRARMSLE